MTKLLVAFRNFAKSPKIIESYFSNFLPCPSLFQRLVKISNKLVRFAYV
jgi:hypothetical protein